MLNWFKLSHHSHSLKLRAHEHTSYAPLLILLLVVGFVLTTFTTFAAHPGPESGSIGLSGTVPANPPETAASIVSPENNTRVTASPQTISGSCPAGTLVQLYKNDIFAGSAPCSSAGTYSIDIDLLIGENSIVARVYDALNQAGPDSNILNIYYDILPIQSTSTAPLVFSNNQLLLNTDSVFRGTFPEHDLNVPINIIGGTPPYAVNIQWGDSNNKVIPRNDNVVFSVKHAYKKAGTYQITLQATDATDRVAFLSVAAIVNGQPDTATVSSTDNTANTDLANKLVALWPLYISALAIVISFWLGEVREKKIIQHHTPANSH